MKVKLLFEEHANNYFLTRTDVTKKTLELTKYVITSFIEFDLNCAKVTDGNNIQLYRDNSTNAQKWCFTPALSKEDKLAIQNKDTIKRN